MRLARTLSAMSGGVSLARGSNAHGASSFYLFIYLLKKNLSFFPSPSSPVTLTICGLICITKRARASCFSFFQDLTPGLWTKGVHVTPYLAHWPVKHHYTNKGGGVDICNPLRQCNGSPTSVICGKGTKLMAVPWE